MFLSLEYAEIMLEQEELIYTFSLILFCSAVVLFLCIIFGINFIIPNFIMLKLSGCRDYCAL
jgi:hypothetical protein